MDITLVSASRGIFNLFVVFYAIGFLVGIFRILTKKIDLKEFLGLVFLYGFFEEPAKNNTEKVVRIIIPLVLLVGLSSYLFQNDSIGSMYEKGNYKAQYYVLAFPEGTEVKNYKVPADIESVINKDDEGKPYRDYYILKIYWPNGGFTTFENEYGSGDVQPGGKTSLTDDNNKKWEIELTKEKVIN